MATQVGCNSSHYHNEHLQYVPCMYDDYENNCHQQQHEQPSLTSNLEHNSHHHSHIHNHHQNNHVLHPMEIRNCYGSAVVQPHELRNRRNVHGTTVADQCHGYGSIESDDVVILREATTTTSTASTDASSSASSSCDADLDCDADGKQSKSGGKSAYKHVPHRDKPPHLVERRNARERRRVQAMNSAFVRLRKCVPVENRNKRISKVKTLQKAIEYISYLEQVLADDDDVEDGLSSSDVRTSSATVDKENSQNAAPRWTTVDSTFKEHSPCISMYDNYV